MSEVASSEKMGRPVTTRSSNATLALTDCGVVQNVTVDGVILTLPATSAGATFIIRCGAGGTGDVGFQVSPNSVDQIAGNGFTAADNKDAILTKATARPGDFIKLVGDGTNGWIISDISGTWTREA